MTMARLILISIAMLLANVAAPTRAATVVIWPVDPIIRPGEQATSLWLENTGAEPVTLQVRSFGWSQPGGTDALTDQDEVVASPPITTVAPGRRQLVRIIRRPGATPAAAPERSYRLIIDELPDRPKGDASGQLNARLAVQMRYSIPLFTYSADPDAQAPRLVTSYTATATGREMEIRNTGTGHARLTDVRLVANGQEQLVKPGLAGYVLPGATLRVPMPAGAPATVKVGVNGRDEALIPNA